MADTNAMADIRGIDIDKAVKGFADMEMQMKRFVTVSPTKAREIRWYQKTSGFLDSEDTTGITASQIYNTSSKSLPVVVEQSWTRNTSYVKKYFVESPWISDEDIADSDVDILTGNLRDLTRAVQRQVDTRIWNVLSNAQSGTGINTNATNAPWNTASFTNVDIIEDLLEAKQNLREDGYNPEGAILLINALDHKQIITWLISSKGSSIPAFASQRVQDGVVMELLGLQVVVDEIVTADYALVFVPKVAVTYKVFTPTTAAIISDPGIGKKIRVWEEGEAILTDPNATNLITNTRT